MGVEQYVDSNARRTRTRGPVLWSSLEEERDQSPPSGARGASAISIAEDYA